LPAVIDGKSLQPPNPTFAVEDFFYCKGSGFSPAAGLKSGQFYRERNFLGSTKASANSRSDYWFAGAAFSRESL